MNKGGKRNAQPLKGNEQRHRKDAPIEADFGGAWLAKQLGIRGREIEETIFSVTDCRREFRTV